MDANNAPAESEVTPPVTAPEPATPVVANEEQPTREPRVFTADSVVYSDPEDQAKFGTPVEPPQGEGDAQNSEPLNVVIQTPEAALAEAKEDEEKSKRPDRSFEGTLETGV